ncbi:Tyrosine transaminase family protein, putative [Anopheles sinensis]|uniref:Tyrosine transaminase family protein, putative n=1 Tax=Anopheles sinensis TaxID=74873 RepID=A0A084W2B2_ANOSI|nr:Tyrosine transaminase family protein, putative [Anopheles sinensis]
MSHLTETFRGRVLSSNYHQNELPPLSNREWLPPSAGVARADPAANEANDTTAPNGRCPKLRALDSVRRYTTITGSPSPGVWGAIIHGWERKRSTRDSFRTKGAQTDPNNGESVLGCTLLERSLVPTEGRDLLLMEESLFCPSRSLAPDPLFTDPMDGYRFLVRLTRHRRTGRRERRTGSSSFSLLDDDGVRGRGLAGGGEAGRKQKSYREKLVHDKCMSDGV